MATLNGITSGYTITARARITSITGTTAFKTDRLRNKSVYEGTEDRGAVSIDIDNSLINYGTITSITINYSGRASNTFYDTPTGRTGYIDGNGNESWAGSGSSNYHSKGFAKKGNSPKAFSDTWTNPPRSNDGRYRFLIGVINEQTLTHIEWAEVTSISLNITYTPHTCSYTTTSQTNATCTTKGSRTEKCTICGATRTVELPALGHNYTSTVTPPTDDTSGYTTHKCSNCGDSYKDSYIYRIIVKANNDGYGTVTGSGDYAKDKVHSFNAVPNKGCKFVEWKGYNSKGDQVYRSVIQNDSLEATENLTLIAYFEKLPPEFTSVSMTYLNKQISASNKVKCNEGFIISVGVT